MPRVGSDRRHQGSDRFRANPAGTQTLTWRAQVPLLETPWNCAPVRNRASCNSACSGNCPSGGQKPTGSADEALSSLGPWHGCALTHVEASRATRKNGLGKRKRIGVNAFWGRDAQDATRRELIRSSLQIASLFEYLINFLGELGVAAWFMRGRSYSTAVL